MLGRLLIILLTAANLGLCGLLVCATFEKLDPVKCLAFSLAATLLGYLLSSALLFLVDVFTIGRALVLETALDAALLGTLALSARGRGKRLLSCEMDWELKKQLIPLALTLLALTLSMGNNGYFGMGQDQGVYQVKAIDLMNGKTEKVYTFEEYDQLEGADASSFRNGVVSRLRGLDNIKATMDQVKTMLRLTGGSEADFQATDGIYHGIPTYPAALALYGTITGVENMAGLQTLLYVLVALFIWFTAQNLGVKPVAAVFMCLIYILSPEAVWLSKSTLTESYLSLVIAIFLYLITEREHSERRWWSAWLVTAFSLLHVSIYVMIPMFLALYFVLYLWDGDRQYLWAMTISSVSFVTCFTFMVVVAPRYTLMNTRPIWLGPINGDNAYPILMTAGLIGLALSIVFRWVKVRGRFRAALQSAGFAWLVRAGIALLLAVSGYLTVRGVSAGGSVEQTVTTNGLYNMLWMTGIVSLPLIVVWVLIDPRRLLKNETGLSLLLLFGYSVLLMCCVLKSKIEYCYYYGRYLVPYIPVVCVLAGIIWNTFSRRAVCVGLLLSAAVCLPFDMRMVISQDDTVSSFDAVTRIAEASGGPGDAVVFDLIEGDAYDTSVMFYLPVKAISGADCYFTDGDLETQLSKLVETHGMTYYVTSQTTDYRVVTRLNEVFSLDDNRSFRLPFCPFPYAFGVKTRSYTVYQYDGAFRYKAGDLATTGERDGEAAIVLGQSQLQYGPYIRLKAGTYRVEYTGSGLDSVWFHPTANVGKTALVMQSAEQDEDHICYEFTIDESADQAEFVVGNNDETDAVIRTLFVRRLTEEK